MKGFSVLLGSLILAAASMAFAADPAFKDYTVTPVFTGPNHKLVRQENSSPMMDQARVQALKGKVNFAGHYILHRLRGHFDGDRLLAQSARSQVLLRQVGGQSVGFRGGGCASPRHADAVSKGLIEAGLKY
ncbi:MULTISPECIES: hypothetical protein [unclassified Pseudomonas]|uniref:hypothetical protein n=1 Tax=unclassified Pseudomonas TaxID=196821 RepID=UPI00215C58BA|nr:hypothetical protein [Pseudomonas sp. S11A4]MCR8977639.1 hypothetical protein [Pseudomonas sp. S11P7]